MRPQYRFYTLLITSLFVFNLSVCSDGIDYPGLDPVSGLPDRVDFNFHIRPLISDRCFKCHDPDVNARKADLRFHTDKGLYAALGKQQDRYPVVAGKPARSEIMKRLISDDPEYVMPPPNANLEVSLYEIALINRWIEQGAQWKPHWSFIPPKDITLPKIENTTWPIKTIDHFVLSRLEAENLQPAPQANKETLIRRVFFDLTGLPPTLPEIDAFLEDDTPDAYENVVDRLLASSAYGERMAVEWLDLARYADTHGYQDDGPRRTWTWRDWVIRSFNDNMPYDQFVTWQLAGDLMPNPSRQQLLVTGFNRNHPQSQEGGIIDGEYRVEYVADRTNTFSKAFLGLTGLNVYIDGTRSKTQIRQDHLFKDIKDASCFSILMAGGGVKAGLTYGETDEFDYNIVKDPMHVHDLQATILFLLGIDHEKLTFKHQGRRYRLTDVHGKIVHSLVA